MGQQFHMVLEQKQNHGPCGGCRESRHGRVVRSETGEDPDQVLWNQGVITFSGKTTFMDVMSTFEKAFGIKVVVEGTKVPSNMPVRMKVYRSAGPDKAFQILQAAGVRFTYRVDPDTGTYYIE